MFRFVLGKDDVPLIEVEIIIPLTNCAPDEENMKMNDFKSTCPNGKTYP